MRFSAVQNDDCTSCISRSSSLVAANLSLSTFTRSHISDGARSWDTFELAMVRKIYASSWSIDQRILRVERRRGEWRGSPKVFDRLGSRNSRDATRRSCRSEVPGLALHRAHLHDRDTIAKGKLRAASDLLVAGQQHTNAYQ